MRRQFSRWMPPIPPEPPVARLGPVGWCVVAALLVALTAAAIALPNVVAIFFGAALFGLLPGKLAGDLEADEAPAPPRPAMSLLEWFILAGLLTALLAMLVVRPIFVTNLLGLVFIASFVVAFIGKRDVRREANERAGEDIGTFARGFDRRAEPFDPWVVRATWDALSHADCPLRPSDRLEDMGIDGLEMEDLFADIATRSGHSLIQMLEHIETVGDFVRVVSVQPRLRRG